jgi:hypothetical protein
VEVKIGIQNVVRELVVDTTTTYEEVEAALAAAVKAEAGIFILQDEKGRRVMVPASKIAYIEYSGSDSRRVGFG